VFVTAFDHYAVRAFDEGAIDYVMKPVEPARLADTVARVQARLRDTQPADTDALLAQLATRLRGDDRLRFIRASVGQTVRLVAVDEIDFLRSEDKYTLVAWGGEAGKLGDALIRTPLKELVAQLDPAQFAQVHRAVVVNLRAISHVTRGANETAEIHLKGRTDVLPVSRNYAHLFRQM
jgi:DNA-binding LytR/AlgR family response regulator